jgi:alpha-N-arabinofuranosidase
MMAGSQTTTIAVVDTAYEIGDIDPRIRGSFVEHLGRCIYGGIYEPGHPKADADGNRLDVIELARELDLSLIRYPGGNFASGYDWRSGIGPAEERPARLDLAWRSIETNAFGLQEMSRWLNLVGADLAYTLNLGTHGLAEAIDLIEYANFPAGTALSDLRIAHGRKEPYAIKTWCLGNEVDGPWQLGHRSATRYAELAAQTAQALRLVDPDIEIAVAGSSQPTRPTFPVWDAEVLEGTYELVDLLSLHAYYWPDGDDLAGYLASGSGLDAYLDAAIATCDYVQAKLRSTKQIGIALDEWNVSFTDDSWEDEEQRWATNPTLIENVYSGFDAVAIGGMLGAILRHSDRVRVACMSLLANVSAPIMTATGGPAWRQTTFLPFREVARLGGDASLQTVVRSPSIATGQYGDVAALDVAATVIRDPRSVTLFVTNRDPNRAQPLEVEVVGLGRGVTAQHALLMGSTASNTQSAPEQVQMQSGTPPECAGNKVLCEVPPASWNVIRLHGGQPV